MCFLAAILDFKAMQFKLRRKQSYRFIYTKIRKEKGPFCLSVTNIRGITKKLGPKNVEVNGYVKTVLLLSKTLKKLPQTLTPGSLVV